MKKCIFLPRKSVKGEKIKIEYDDIVLKKSNIIKFVIDCKEGLSLFGSDIEKKEEDLNLRIDISFSKAHP